jgi:hypothetical protein
MVSKLSSRFLLTPFHGTVHSVETDHGIAETTDGKTWTLYVSHENIVAHTGLSEVRYGSWSRDTGFIHSRVTGGNRSNLIDGLGQSLLDELMRHADEIPFSANDIYQCWLLDEKDQQPLALLESSTDPDAVMNPCTPVWRPAQSAFNEFTSGYGDAQALTEQVRKKAGKSPKTQWYNCEALANDFLPPLLISQAWEDERESSLVEAFIDWLSPWLLQIKLSDVILRNRLEQCAWQRPLEVERVYALFPEIIDRKGLKVARVKAQLMGDSSQKKYHEPFTEKSDDYHPI